MTKTFISILMTWALVGCGTAARTDPQETSAKLTEKETPAWFLKPETNLSSYKAVGDGVSASMSGALSNARTAAFEGLCQSAGSVVRSQSKQFRQDTAQSSQQINTTATRNFCPDLDVAGATVEKQHVIRDGYRFRAFVLVSLSKSATSSRDYKTTSEAEFKELDRMNEEYKNNKQ